MIDPLHCADHTYLYFAKHLNLFVFNSKYINTIQMSENVTIMGMHREVVSVSTEGTCSTFSRLFLTVTRFIFVEGIFLQHQLQRSTTSSLDIV
jgi:hypothetical protein